jgi:TetR/AcrR family transcriptional repressor of nem operon
VTTKEKLLQVTFHEIYENGYYATSVDKILKKANMNKGSMYHYFKSKKELVLAVIDAHVYEYIDKKYGAILTAKKDYIGAILTVLKNKDSFNFICGCRLNSLVQELSHQDLDFKIALEKVYFRFEEILEEALKKAIEKKEIAHPDVKQLAVYVVASIEGCLSTAKKSQDGDIFGSCILQLEHYLNQLKV